MKSIDDIEIELFYPEEYRKHSQVHWTPIEVAKQALDWLDVNKDTHVLDIGSGVGKFCSIGARNTNGRFTGVEIRKDLVDVANSVKKKLSIPNIEFIHSDITEINFQKYNSFYYYNPFCEYLAISDQIDDSISFSQEKYREYEDYVIEQFIDLPINTKVVTYFAETFTFPDSYELKELKHEGKLALWMKTK